MDPVISRTLPFGRNNDNSGFIRDKQNQSATVIGLFGEVKRKIVEALTAVYESHNLMDDKLMAIQSSTIPEDGIVEPASVDKLAFQCQRQ